MASILKDIGPVRLFFGGVDIGQMRSAIFNHTEDWAPVMTAEHGTSPKDKIGTGSATSLTGLLTQTSNTTLALIHGNATEDGNQLDVNSIVGISARDIAQTLVAKPLSGGVVSVDPTEWLTIPIASPEVDISITFDPDTQRDYNVVFQGYRVEAEDVVSGVDFVEGRSYYIGLGETA